MCISLKPLPMTSTACRSGTVVLPSLSSCLLNSHSNSSSWNKGPGSLAHAWKGFILACTEKQGKIYKQQPWQQRQELLSLCFSWLLSQDLDAWWWIDCMCAVEDKNDLRWPFPSPRSHGLDLKFLIPACLLKCSKAKYLVSLPHCGERVPGPGNASLFRDALPPHQSNQRIHLEETIRAGQKPRGQTGE